MLGELVAGILLGNLPFGGFPPFEAIARNETIEVVAGIGALILLFEVGVESTVAQMMQVGVMSLIVAVLGVIAPFALGWGAAALLLPEAGPYVHAFVGATLTATSVGITARVLRDLGASGSREARIILGAAVIDDVLGLIILGAVGGAIAAAAQGSAFSVASVLGTFVTPVILGLAAALTAAAIVGKQACALGVSGPGGRPAGRRHRHDSTRRGRADLRQRRRRAQLNGVPVIAPAVFSAIVAMIVVTTMVTPPALQWSLSRRPRSTSAVA